MAKSDKGLDLGLVIKLAGVILNSTRNKQPEANGQGGGMTVDWRGLAWGLAGIGGQQLFGWFGQRRQNRQLQKQLAAGLITPEDVAEGRLNPDATKKGNAFGPGALVGAVVGAALYIMAMSPEQRNAFFKQLDQAATQLSGFINELQGKPYSNDYEPKAN